MRAFTGSFTFSILSNSTLVEFVPTFSTGGNRPSAPRPVSRGSIVIGPRGLSQVMPLAAAMKASPSVLPLGLLQHLVDQVHSVVAADREQIRIDVAVVSAEVLHEILVHRRIVSVVVMIRRDRRRARRRPRSCSAVSSMISPLPKILILSGVTPRSAIDFMTAAGSLPAGTKTKTDSGLASLTRCTKAEKSGLVDRHAQRADDLAAGFLEGAMEGLLDVMAGRVIRHHGEGAFDALLVGPGPERFDQLRYRHRHAHAVVGPRR